MSLQRDTELRDMVSQTLENTGVLAKIRAELRASVFLVLEEHEAFKGRNLSFASTPFKDFLSTQEGIVAVSLVREFLEYFGLEFTASVFEPETQAGNDYEYIGRSRLAHDLKLNSGKKAPLIAQVLQESKFYNSSSVPQQKEESVDNAPRKEKMKDEKKCQEISSHVLKTDLTNGVVRSSEKEVLENRSSSLGNSPPLFQSYTKKPDSLKLDLNHMNLKPTGSSLSSLGSLPPLGLTQNNQATRTTNNRNNKQVFSDIKTVLDVGSESPEHNYEEDFHPSGSEKTSKGTMSGSGSEVDEEMSVGMDDQSGSGNEKAASDL